MSGRRSDKTRKPQDIACDAGFTVSMIGALARHCGEFAGQLQIVGNEDREDAANEEREEVVAMQAGIAALANEALRDIDEIDSHYSEAA